ncbi:MAG: CopG family transcriptional regulator [Thermoplasmata archaeon]|nr:MAG: CopG family transcriptional regulator [Thermoplasmata archaeon]
MGRKRKERAKCKRVQVSFTDDQWRLIEKFKGIMGNDDAEVVRNIVLAWLAEKSVVAETVKKGAKQR